MLVPQKPLKEDAPDVDIVNVKLNEPPSYKIGEWREAIVNDEA